MVIELIRKHRIYFVITQLSIFSIIYASSAGYGIIYNNHPHAIVDFEDIEKEEGESSEKQQKEYFFSNFNLRSSKYLKNRQEIEFSQINFDHSLDIFFEVVTPPP